jgi:hypothetical protein
LGLVDPLDRINPPDTSAIKQTIAKINKHIAGNKDDDNDKDPMETHK